MGHARDRLAPATPTFVMLNSFQHPSIDERLGPCRQMDPETSSG
jgi:hypothetical protein